MGHFKKEWEALQGHPGQEKTTANPTVTKISDGEYQFDVGPDEDNHMLSMKVTHEGIVIDVVDSDGGIVRSAYQFWSDLDDLTLKPH